MHMKMEDQKKGLFLHACVSCLLLSCVIAVSANDVPDGVVFTDLTKTVHQGNRAVLKCHFYGTPIAVYWKKGYDPTQSPNLITWVEGETPSGSCVQDKACEMHDDFFLIINEVKIADQGRYICRVSNYLGILIHNFTDLNVFASPKEPYPVIEGCNSSRQSCVIHTIHPINITCSVYGYYPDVDLFMLHGANRLDILNIEEVVNDDGTKSKSISTRATVSETQYVCVASDIPGTTNQRTVTALVAPIVSNDTKASETPPHNSSFQGQTTPLNTTNNVESEKHVSHIVVPIVVILLTCFLLAFVFWKTHRHTKVETAETDPESIPMVNKEPEKGNVSFFEIWVLLYNTKGIDMVGIRHTLTELGIEDVKENATKWQAYSALCKWKDRTTLGDQAKLIRDAFYKARYEEAWKNIERSSKMLAKASEGTLEKIVRSIDDQELRNKFLNKLIPGRATNNPEPPTRVKSTSQQDMMTELKKWSSITNNENQMVLLSIALEDAGCCPVDRRFFTHTLSFYEIWCLLYNTESTCLDIRGIRRTFHELGINVEGDLNKQRAYTVICSWKDNTTREYQTMILRDSLEKAKFERVWEMSEQRANMSSKVSEYLCEKIMRSIDDHQLKNRFLNRLIPGRETHNPETPGSVKSIIRKQDMVKELKEWSSTTDNENQMVLLSIALEDAECRPVDRTFFTGMKVSFFELWSVAYDGSQDNMMKLQRLLNTMGINDVNPTEYGIYKGLCEWKNKEHDYQMSLLRDELSAANLTDVWEHIIGLREKRGANVPDDTLSHILWHIQSPRKLEDLLRELIPDRKNQQVSQVVTKELTEEATQVLRKWRAGPVQQNPFVLLSLALETAGCIPLDREFFTVPDHLKKPISSQEVEACVSRLTGRHCRRLAKAAEVSDDKKISATINENTETLFDTQSMIRDWIDRQQCSHYDKRCRLTQAVIKIGRHDLINCFGVNDHYHSIGKDPGGLHPYPNQFSHESTYIDDIREIVSFLPKEKRADFCKPMLISLNEDGKDEKDLEPQDLENMITATNTVYEPLEKLVKRFQLTLTRANCRGFEVTDEELEIAAEFINAANTKLQPSQHQHATRIEANTDKVTTVNGTCHAEPDDNPSETVVGGNNTHLAASNEVNHSDTVSETNKTLDEIHGNNGKDDNLEQIVSDPQSNTPRSVSFMLKRWKSFSRKEETCHRELRKSIETLGIKECIVNVAPAKYLYKVELLRIAFDLLMRDVLPFVDALGMNQKQITEYIASSPELERGSLGLLQQLWKRIPKSDTHRRHDFSLALRNIGYEGLARSVYLDYEPSQSELNSLLSILWNAERLQIFTRLELGEDDQAACLETDGQVNLVEVVRRWKNQIRPVPRHYRLEIAICLQAAGRQELADKMLAGRKGKMEADENVLRNICGRLEADQITNLCKLLDLKTGQSQEESITSVTNWIIKWINDFDPSSKKPKLPGSQHKLKHRKNINNKMFYLGCHELAEEIMHLEIGILSE